ncbi:hypothetical protein ACHMW6_25835 [Pseudoduganella sp. UC29_106]|uniref:hypothetical protein n=1 Tax=Pseudoduganella sp. UC29_106 TaxID=3374553 RepID=UPI0037578AEE
MKLPPKWHTFFDRISPRQRQYVLATGVIGAGVGVFWAFLALSSQPAPQPAAAVSRDKVVTNPELSGGVAPLQVAAVDQWLGTAGKELAQYKIEREGQEKFNADRKANETSILQRLAELEKREGTPGAQSCTSAKRGTDASGGACACACCPDFPNELSARCAYRGQSATAGVRHADRRARRRTSAGNGPGRSGQYQSRPSSANQCQFRQWRCRYSGE